MTWCMYLRWDILTKQTWVWF